MRRLGNYVSCSHNLFFAHLQWFMDRLRTTLNVTGDAVVCGMVAHLTSDDELVPDLEGTTGVEVPKEEEEA